MNHVLGVDLGLRHARPDPERLASRVIRNGRHLVDVHFALILHHGEHGARTLEIDPRAAVARPANAGCVLGAEEQSVAPDRSETKPGRETLIRGRVVRQKRRVLSHPRDPGLREKLARPRVAIRGRLELGRDRNPLAPWAVAISVDGIGQHARCLVGAVGLAANTHLHLLIEGKRQGENYWEHRGSEGGVGPDFTARSQAWFRYPTASGSSALSSPLRAATMVEDSPGEHPERGGNG